MKQSKFPLENKSYYGGIYLYFKQQKLSKVKDNDNKELTSE
jgi:hypothetical protein